MGEVVGIGSVVLAGQQDPRLPIVEKKPHLVAMPRHVETPQQQVAGAFTKCLPVIENFVVLAQTKDGKFMFFPCVDQDPGVSLFIDICKAELVEQAAEKLNPTGFKPAFA